MAERFTRNPNATEREAGGVLFLANPEIGTLYRANETVAALWRLAVEPTTVEDAVAVFQEAFPETARAEIETLITDAFFDLVEEGLLDAE